MPTKDELELKKFLEDSANTLEQLSKKDGMEERFVQFCITEADRHRRALRNLFPPKDKKIMLD